jgi:hypothetical protein
LGDSSYSEQAFGPPNKGALLAKGEETVSDYPKRVEDPPFSNNEPPLTFAKSEFSPLFAAKGLEPLENRF